MRLPSLKKYTPWLLSSLPFVLVAGILDYRFHNYFWGWLDRLRFLQGEAMFDFVSVFTGFGLLLVALWLFMKKPKLQWQWVSAPVVLILVGLGAAWLGYEPVEPVIRSFGNQALVNYLLPMALFVVLLTQKRGRFEQALLLAFGLLGMLCLFDFATNWLPGDNKDFLGRLVWPYIDPFVDMHAESANWLAYIFGPLSLLAALRWKRSWLEKSVLVISLFVLALTQSYTGLGITGALLGLLLFVRLPKYRMAMGIAAGLLLVVGVVTQYDSPKFQILLGNYHQENSIERRAQIHQVSWAMLSENAWTGLGPGNYQSAFRVSMDEVLDEPIPEREIPPHAHNLLLHFWSELGLAGLLAMLIFYGMTAWNLLRHGNLNYLMLAYPLGHGLMDVPYGLEEASMLFWIWTILALSSSINSKVS